MLGYECPCCDGFISVAKPRYRRECPNCQASTKTQEKAGQALATLRKELERARSDALEEAAKAIENRGSNYDSTAGERYAKVIRALKGQQP